jgi:hypothetical protein
MTKKPECNGARSFFNITLATNTQPLLLLLPKTCLLPVRRYRSSIHRKILIKYREGLVIELQNYYKILQRREFQLYWRLSRIATHDTTTAKTNRETPGYFISSVLIALLQGRSTLIDSNMEKL